jgi:hypothetical protein
VGGNDQRPPPDTHIGPPDDYWFSAAYLGYTFKPAPLGTPLLTTTDPAGGTRALVGAADASLGWTSGLALSGGVWLDDRHTIGFELGGFLTGRRASATEVAAAPGQTLTRPFVDALTGAPAQFFVSAPGFLDGTFVASATAQLGGTDTRLVWNLTHSRQLTIDVFAGFRYLDLDETLLLTQFTRPVGTGIILLNGVSYDNGTPLVITDRFRTRNQFYGGEVGARAEWRLGPAFLGVNSTVGFGPTHQVVETDGQSQVPGVVVPGGFLVVPGGNAGRNVTNRFAMMTQVGAELGVYLTGRARLSLGYDLLYLGSVARPGDQIDQVVNTRLVPTTRRFGSLSGVASPLPTGGRTDFSAQGLRVGLEFRF